MADTSKKYVKTEHKSGVLDALADYFGGQTSHKRIRRPVGIAGQNKRSTGRPATPNLYDTGNRG